MIPSYSEVPLDTREATRDLQERIGRQARMTFVISGVMLLASLSMDLLLGAQALGIGISSRVVHVSAQVGALFVWRLCRGKTLSPTALEILDPMLTVGTCICWGLLGLGVPEQEPIEFSVILATTYTLIARSVIVPSSYGRTLAISAVSVFPTVAFFLLRGMPFVPGASAGRVYSFLVFAVLWCGVAVFVAALNSRQLYGLRQQIREVGRLGQYTLEEKIGGGGMGVVYRATHAMLRRPAAIKLLTPGRDGEKDLARFEREVQLTSRLAHPNTISIFDYGRTADGVFYYVMEYLDGFDLQRIVELEGPLAPGRVLHILTQVSGALAEAHSLGLIHRDIKPANILLGARVDEPDVVKVVDFGLVKTLENGASVEPSVTNVGAVVGTPTCLAPEAITNPDTVDARADLYALGAVGYFLLTGRNVFDARSVIEMCSKHLHEAPVAPSERLGKPLPRELEALILTCLAKSADARPASAAVLQSALQGYVSGIPYDADAARLWWQDRAPELRARARMLPGAPHAETMAIDLRGRAGLGEPG